MYTAVSGQAAIFKQMEVIANNLANSTTAGFKAERILFEKVLKDEQHLYDSPRKEILGPTRLSTDEYVHIKGSYTDLSTGPIEVTHNPLDVAIINEGFFVLNTPNGPRYTRAGQFSLDDQGRLVSFEGYSVQGQSGDITLGVGKIQVLDDGSITLNGNLVDRLRIVKIESEFLIRESAQKFDVPMGGSVQDLENFQVQGGAIEGSNVNPVRELTDMIFAARMYESLQKVQQSNSQMTRNRNDAFGRG